MATLAFINQKGGVAKTTSAVHVATALAALHGKRVLLIDLDPQAQCCLTFGYPDAGTTRDSVKLGHLLEQVEEGNTDVSESLPRALLKTGIPRLDLLPGQKKLRRYFLPETGREERHDLVSSLISAIQQSSTPAGQRAGTYAYDWVILDTPPALEAPTKNAIAASDFAIVPIEPSYYSLQGFAMFLEGVHSLLPRLGKDADGFYRIVPTRVNTSATRARADLQDWLGEFSDRFFRYTRASDGPDSREEIATIRQCQALSRCLTDLTTVFTFDPRSNGAYDYNILSKLIIAYERQRQAQGQAAQPTGA